MGDVFDRVAKKAEKQDVFDRVSPPIIFPTERVKVSPPSFRTEQMQTRGPLPAAREGILTKPLIGREAIAQKVSSLSPTLKTAAEFYGMDTRNIDELRAARNLAMAKIASGPHTQAEVEAARDLDFRVRNIEGGTGTISGFTSPKGMALAAAASIPGAPGLTAQTYFLAQGAHELTKPTEKGETRADVLERRLGAAGQVAMSIPTGAQVSRVGGQIRSLPQAIAAVKSAPLEVRSAIHDNALDVRDHIDFVEKSVQADVSQQMEVASKGVEAKTPQAVAAEPVRAEIRQDLGELVKIKETLPKSLQAILESTTKQPKTTGPSIMGRVMDLSNPNDLLAFQRFKAQGVFSPEEIARIEGGVAKTNWGFEEAKQLRSDLGRELWGKTSTSMPRTVYAAAAKAYGKMSEALQQAADNAGLGKEWKAANDLNHQFMEDFWRSPVRKIVKGQYASKIYEPLAGNPAEQVSRILDKYQSYGYDKPRVAASVKEYQRAQDAVKRGKASKYDYGIIGGTLAAAIFGKGFPVVGAAYEAARFGIPKAQQLAAIKALKKVGPLQTKPRTP